MPRSPSGRDRRWIPGVGRRRQADAAFGQQAGRCFGDELVERPVDLVDLGAEAVGFAARSVAAHLPCHLIVPAAAPRSRPGDAWVLDPVARATPPARSRSPRPTG